MFAGVKIQRICQACSRRALLLDPLDFPLGAGRRGDIELSLEKHTRRFVLALDPDGEGLHEDRIVFDPGNETVSERVGQMRRRFGDL